MRNIIVRIEDDPRTKYEREHPVVIEGMGGGETLNPKCQKFRLSYLEARSLLRGLAWVALVDDGQIPIKQQCSMCGTFVYIKTKDKGYACYCPACQEYIEGSEYA